MKITQQVTSPEISAKIHALGLVYDSYFVWVSDFLHRNFLVSRGKQTSGFAALTTAELGDILKRARSADRMKAYMEVMLLEPQSIVADDVMMNMLGQPEIPALVLINLLENKLISLK